jgi:CRP-like cAMP-binding protein
MFDLLRTHIQKRIDLTEEEFALGTTFFTPKKLQEQESLLQEGNICKVIAFVLQGCLRCYTIDDKGEEHVVQFAIEDWWISDLKSFFSGEPSAYNIDALEDSEILLLDKAKREELLLAIPKFERFFRVLGDRHYIATHERILASLSASAEERYLSFLKSYPTLAQRVSQRQIASYLGITSESLSRIRKNLAKKG